MVEVAIGKLEVRFLPPYRRMGGNPLAWRGASVGVLGPASEVGSLSLCSVFRAWRLGLAGVVCLGVDTRETIMKYIYLK